MRVPPNFASPQQDLEKKQNAASSSYHESEKENHPPTIHDDSFLSMNPSQDNSRSISSPISSSLTQSDRRNSSTTTCSSNNRNDENHQNSNEWNTCFSSFDENSCCSNDADDDDGTTTCWNDASKGFRKNNDGSKNNHTSPSSSSGASSLVLNHHQRVVVVVDETMSQGTEELKKRPRGISSNFGEEDSEAMSMNGVGHDDTTIDQDDSICLRKRINPLKSKRVKKNDHPLTSDSSAFQDSWTLYSLSDTPQEMIEIIISFLDDSSRALAALTCSKFHQACENIVAREFTYYFHQENNSLILPLAQGPVSTNDIENVQNKFNMTLPFLLKIFLTLTDGREPWHNTFIHFSNMIRPIREWKLLKRDVLLLGTTLDSNIQLLVNSNHVFFLRNVTQNSLERLHFKDWIQRKNFSFEYVHYNIEKVNERRVLPYSLTHFNSIHHVVWQRRILCETC
ncbi:hypothetical protein C9374_012306 [Naegleria lovaniensis]|uniref:F-box domain-containing protein n=1 Tax=Naegleria lovaniensis TaxID=51637 RepID=A0AA88GCZ8_NAELO|nr:uncharacterized protein C9374_012306 [Naegleria lovaniensis]KAG2373317.1 hypothetical protein C9374_012306 [Naegleria lovaniensis]